jgi:hypothetical protein
VRRVEDIKNDTPHVYEDILGGRYQSIAEAERACNYDLSQYKEARQQWLKQPAHDKDWDKALEDQVEEVAPPATDSMTTSDGESAEVGMADDGASGSQHNQSDATGAQPLDTPATGEVDEDASSSQPSEPSKSRERSDEDILGAFEIVADELEDSSDMAPYKDIEPKKLRVAKEVVNTVCTWWRHRE